MAKKYRVTLMPEERQELQALIAKGKASARKLAHARVLLQVDEAQASRTDEETAAALNLSVRTIERVRERFVEQGFAAALLSAPNKRVYARTFDGASEARLIALACGAPPEGKARWTLLLLAEQLVEVQVLDTVSRECVRQALKKTNSSRTGERGGAFRPSSRRSLSATGKRCWRCTIDRRIRSARWCAWTRPSGNSSARCGSRYRSSRARWSVMTVSMYGRVWRACSLPLSRSPVGGTSQ
jgi:Homeodomain-like domain